MHKTTKSNNLKHAIVKSLLRRKLHMQSNVTEKQND